MDEAGQMSLANVLAVTRAAHNIVLLGDPQQLEQPKKGTHPEGVGLSALQHMLGSHATIPAGRGIFLPETWRLSPALPHSLLKCSTRVAFAQSQVSSGSNLSEVRSLAAHCGRLM